MSDFSQHYSPAPLPSAVEMYVPPDRPRKLVPAILFLASVCTTTLAGMIWYAGFVDAPLEIDSFLDLLTDPSFLVGGLSFSVSILVILVAHELGHYLTCVRYGIRATLPYLIPVPPPVSPFGTFGAVIKIKSPFENTRQLFDVGIAGPIAGFLFIIPALVFGLVYSREFVVEGTSGIYFNFGEPLLLQIASHLFLPDTNADITLHPVGWAAWFGMLATSLNLLPVGQLDGGHIVYAVLGKRGHRIVSFVTLGALLVLGATLWLGYLLFGTLVFLLGFRHPSTAYNYPPIGRGRILLAIVALIILILTFIPVPVDIVEYTNRL
ncbi:MAG: site-2 protease family protein [Acidobacteria bacterium]|nr:MAG: site-2 protease family protein [Acidobacteriota bacterium]